ncbi:MAG: murein L,D-transpeptidase family protein [Alphaproteobacteria bacterium]
MGLVVAAAVWGSPAMADWNGSTRLSPIPTSLRAEEAFSRVNPKLVRDLEAKGLSYGAPLFVRIFKLTRQLEVWLEDDDGRYSLFRTYGICEYSGGMGPKLREGDRQSPEGFYTVRSDQLNPHSKFHLSFDLGFPNAYDRAHGRTGNLLMVHGSCVSQGCFAMTDARMEEIYSLAAAALRGGQDGVPVHIFPFKMTDVNIGATQGAAYHGFWMNLKQGHDLFEETGVPPAVWVERGIYRFARRQPTAEQVIAASRSSALPGRPEPKRAETPGLTPLHSTPCGAPQCPLPTVQ